MDVCPSVSTPLSCALEGGTPSRNAGAGILKPTLLRLDSSALAEAIMGGAFSGADFRCLFRGMGSCNMHQQSGHMVGQSSQLPRS